MPPDETTTILFDFDPTDTDTPAAVAAPRSRADPAAAPGQYRSLPFVPELRACGACPARREAQQVVVGIGPIDAVGMVIGQNPGAEEDVAGEPFIGAGGEMLNQWLRQLGLDRSKLVITNALKCHTTDNRVPRTTELRTCFEHGLAKELSALDRLQVLFPVGKPASWSILGKAAPPMTPLSAHHFVVRVREDHTVRDLHVFPLPHPAFLLRAVHLGPLMKMVLSHVRLTLEQELPAAYLAMKKAKVP